MNEDILKGSWLEIKGRIKEKWGKLTGNEFDEIEGKNEKLLGLLRKQYGYTRVKAKLEYKDTVELVKIVSRIREILKRKENITAIAFIARYGQQANNQEHPITSMEKNHGYDTDRYFGSRRNRRTSHLASQ